MKVESLCFVCCEPAIGHFKTPKGKLVLMCAECSRQSFSIKRKKNNITIPIENIW